MCGFFFSSTDRRLDQALVRSATESVARRGPDAARYANLTSASGRHVTLLHYLLDISGSSVEQPYWSNLYPNIYTLFNGEIYNFQSLGFPNSQSDTDVLHKLAVSGEDNLSLRLDGEFAFLIYDHSKDLLRVFTDPFLTKPVFIGRSSNPLDYALSSYPSALSSLGFENIHALEPNSTYSITANGSGINTTYNFPVRHFDLTQNVETYDCWEEAFIESVRKRVQHGNHRPMISLSSGYDSGAIALALNILGIKYETFTILAGENEDVLRARFVQNKKFGVKARVFNGLSRREIAGLKDTVRKEVESFKYHHFDDEGVRLELWQDTGAIGAYFIAREAARNGYVVNLSGMGADEIFSDYGYAGVSYAFHSQFGGNFPADLRDIFPWRKFYGDTQRSYLMKEEIVFGHFGLESRYPFLDTNVVQQFLALTPALKNSEYKAPIHFFLNKHGYPFEKEKKRGFVVKRKPWYRIFS